MRIAFLCGEYTLPGGGIGAYVHILSRALADRGHDVHVLSCLVGQSDADELRDGVWVHSRAKPRVRGVARALGGWETSERVAAALGCRRELARLGAFDVVETSDWGAEALFTPVPTVVTLHGPLGLMTKLTGSARSRDVVVADRLERLAVARAGAVTAPSSHLLVELSAMRWTRRSAQVIPHPIEAPVHSGRDASETTPTVVGVGRIGHLKGWDTLVEAGGLLAEQVPELEIVLVGDAGRGGRTAYAESLLRRAGELGVRLRLAGTVDRDAVPGHVAQARVIAQPTRWDTFGMAGLEAMAAGRPVVTTTRNGLHELVSQAGGTVVPPDDPAALATALAPYLLDRDHASRVGAAAAGLVRRTCDPGVVADQKERLYASVVVPTTSR